MQELLSLREVARRLNVNESAVRRAKKEGKLGDCLNVAANKVDWKKAQKNAWVQQNQVVKPKAGVSRAKAIEKMEGGKASRQVGRGAKSVAAKPLKAAKVSKTGQQPAPETKPPVSTQDDEITEDDLLTGVVITRSMQTGEAMRLREVFGAALDKVKLQEAEGSLVKRVDVEKNLFNYGNQLKKSLLSYADTVIDDVLAAPNKVEALNIMKLKMNQLLNLYANPDNWNIKTTN